jgi:translation machinery-associated protein 16
MPIALNKVQKKIRRKKGALDALGDRDKNRMNRAALRDQKLKKQAILRHKRIEHDSARLIFIFFRQTMTDLGTAVIRVGYFKVATKCATEPLGTEKIRELIERFGTVHPRLAVEEC